MDLFCSNSYLFQSTTFDLEGLDGIDPRKDVLGGKDLPNKGYIVDSWYHPYEKGGKRRVKPNPIILKWKCKKLKFNDITLWYKMKNTYLHFINNILRALLFHFLN